MIKRHMIFIFALISLNLNAQQYEQGVGFVGKWTLGQWDGDHSFRDVYCLKFPDPELALDIRQHYFSNNAVHLTTVTYPNKTMINVVVSTIPAGRSNKEEMSRLLKIEREGEKFYDYDYHIKTPETKLGKTITLKIKGVAPAGKKPPFPLVRPIFNSPKKPIASLSIHRLFVRGQDRYEIAVLQLAPDDADENTEDFMTAELTKIADETLDALYDCSSKRPLREPN